MRRVILIIVLFTAGLASAFYANGTSAYLSMIRGDEYDPALGQIFYGVKHECPDDILVNTRFDVSDEGGHVLGRTSFVREKNGERIPVLHTDVEKICGKIEIGFSNSKVNYGRDPSTISLNPETQLVNDAKTSFDTEGETGRAPFISALLNRALGRSEVTIWSMSKKKNEFTDHIVTVALYKKVALSRAIPEFFESRNVWLQNHYYFRSPSWSPILVELEDTEASGFRDILIIIAGFLIGAALTALGSYISPIFEPTTQTTPKLLAPVSLKSRVLRGLGTQSPVHKKTPQPISSNEGERTDDADSAP